MHSTNQDTRSLHKIYAVSFNVRDIDLKFNGLLPTISIPRLSAKDELTADGIMPMGGSYR